MSFLQENRELVLAFRAGEKGAVAEVYEHYLPMVMDVVSKGFSFRSGAQTYRFHGATSRFVADDLVADVFVRAFRPEARAAYDGLRPYGAYLSTIARNTIIDRQRKKDPLAMALTEPLEEAGPALQPREPETPEHAQELKELSELAQAFVAALAPRERGVLEERFVEGVTQAEAARALSISVPTVRKLERRVMEDFFDYMRGKGYFEHADTLASRGGGASILALALLLSHGLPR